MIALSTPTTLIGTSIQVHFIALSYVAHDDGRVVLMVQLLDSAKRVIAVPRPIRPMTTAEQAAFLQAVAHPGDTTTKALARAAAPYIQSAYGITYPI